MARSGEAGGKDATVAVRLLCSDGGHPSASALARIFFSRFCSRLQRRWQGLVRRPDPAKLAARMRR
ncbi:uncharacterized protein DS421_15g503190 [Arachis hypogaea]|nr:uncharacterized protein DS421_15g503190 [Arachis hypogaea]